MSSTLPRKDGRQLATQSRARTFTQGALSAFDGSATWSQGATVVTASVNGPVAARASVEDYRRATVQAFVKLGVPEVGSGGASRIVGDRAKLRIQQNETKLQRMITNVVGSVVLLENFPRCCFNVTVHVLFDDGSVVAAAFNALMVALIDAAVPCRTTFAATTVALIRKAEIVAMQTASYHYNNNASVEGEDGESAAVAVIVVDPTAEEQERALVVGHFVHSLPQCGGGVLACDVKATIGGSAAFNTQTLDALTQIAERAAADTFTFVRVTLRDLAATRALEAPTTNSTAKRRRQQQEDKKVDDEITDDAAPADDDDEIVFV